MQGQVSKPDSIRDLILVAGEYPGILWGFFCLLPVAVILLRLMHGKDSGADSPWKYVYTILVYLACIPGILSAVLTAYTLFFTGENLLDVSLSVYFLPLVSMLVTLVLIGQFVSFSQIPGFDRLSGLMVTIGITFAIVFALSRTRIWFLFGGSIYTFIALASSVFGLLKWGTSTLMKGKSADADETIK